MVSKINIGGVTGPQRKELALPLPGGESAGAEDQAAKEAAGIGSLRTSMNIQPTKKIVKQYMKSSRKESNAQQPASIDSSRRMFEGRPPEVGDRPYISSLITGYQAAVENNPYMQVSDFDNSAADAQQKSAEEIKRSEAQITAPPIESRYVAATAKPEQPDN